MLFVAAVLGFLTVGTVRAVPAEILAHCRAVLDGDLGPSESAFWRHIVSPCRMAVQHFDDRLIVLFCANFYRYPVCSMVDRTLKHELRTGTHDAFYAVSDSMTFARDLRVSHFPALTQIVSGRLIPFRSKLTQQNVLDWLARVNARQSSSINYTNFEDIVRSVQPTAVFVYRDNGGCMARPDSWWRNLVRSMYDVPSIRFADMNADAWNELIMRQRLGTDLRSTCPQLLVVSNYSYVSFENQIRRHGLTNDIRRFIEAAVQADPRLKWSPAGEDLTDIEFQYEFMEQGAAEAAYRWHYTAIGITGGIGVIALAASIFWGLSSSAYTNDYQNFI